LSFYREPDFIACDFPFVQRLQLVVPELLDNGKGDFVSRDLPLGDFSVTPAPAADRTSQGVARNREGERGLHRPLRALPLCNPCARDIRRRRRNRQRQQYGAY
jgi:hypothetical protein